MNSRRGLGEIAAAILVLAVVVLLIGSLALAFYPPNSPGSTTAETCKSNNPYCDLAFPFGLPQSATTTQTVTCVTIPAYSLSTCQPPITNYGPITTKTVTVTSSTPSCVYTLVGPCLVPGSYYYSHSLQFVKTAQSTVTITSLTFDAKTDTTQVGFYPLINLSSSAIECSRGSDCSTGSPRWWTFNENGSAYYRTLSVGENVLLQYGLYSPLAILHLNNGNVLGSVVDSYYYTPQLAQVIPSCVQTIYGCQTPGDFYYVHSLQLITTQNSPVTVSGLVYNAATNFTTIQFTPKISLDTGEAVCLNPGCSFGTGSPYWSSFDENGTSYLHNLSIGENIVIRYQLYESVTNEYLTDGTWLGSTLSCADYTPVIVQISALEPIT